jgi:coenzyme F420-reducing hydrogenase delta subunit
MCSGRVDPDLRLKALSLGADGVMIAGCHPGECHYIEQNYKAMRRFHMLRHTLRRWASRTRRVQLVWASAAEGQQLAEAIDRWCRDVKPLGPLGWSQNWEENGERLKALEDIVNEHARGDGGTGMSATVTTKPAAARRPNPTARASWPSTGPRPAAVAKSRSWASTTRSWTSPPRSIWSSAPVSPTARSAISSRWPTAKSTSACSTAAFAPANRSTWPSCCARNPRC